ncbi:ATP-binding protein [Empedobacter sp. GD03739]|uniref:ATP-binding protein n=1 Tax=Empedobacter sp. GD03739 TaxID=2975376 RepID=UPI0024471932|nr:ATP-binding protein [Empedobacter sp. GD03739]MDH1602598.1 ATP-binding protein [Empedobacter sp. GD03739]
MKLTEVQKKSISEALNAYLKQHQMSANEFVKRSEINERYIGAILKGQIITGNVLIADKWYKMIAEKIDFSLKKEYWEVRPTAQMMRMLETLQEAREHSTTHVIIGETGCGKTFTSELFRNKFPVDTYKITVGSLDTIGDLLDKTLEEMKISTPKTKSKKISAIADFLKGKQMIGEYPTVIYDECEYMKQPALCSMKELYDGLVGYSALVLIGTDQLLDNLDKLRKKNRSGIPQFYRRIKFGIRELNPIDRSFDQFIQAIEDKELKVWLKKNCENYGELHDVLVPAMREAERMNEPLTLGLVRKILGNPRI